MTCFKSLRFNFYLHEVVSNVRDFWLILGLTLYLILIWPKWPKCDRKKCLNFVLSILRHCNAVACQENTSINARKTTKGLVAVETTQVKKISFVNTEEVLCFSGNSTKTESRSSQTDPLSKIMHALEVPA